MLGMSLAFWVVLFAFFVMGRRRRRWERWARMNDPRYVGSGPWGPGPWGQPRSPELQSPERDAYVEQLETRVARLEERLDFTEKLLADRHAEKVER
jgi:hypothetical protein